MYSCFRPINLFFASVLTLVLFSCSKKNPTNDSLYPEQAFLKPFATTEVPGQWRFTYHDGWEGDYDTIAFNNDGIYDTATKAYYGTGKVLKGLYFDSTAIKWRVQYKQASVIFMWVFDEISFNSIPDHILGIPLLKGTSTYETKWVVSDDGSDTYGVDVTKLN